MILVTSAAGGLGSDVVSTLLRAGHRVRAFVRPGRALPPAFCNADIAYGDFFDDASVRAAMEGVEKVFHISPPHRLSEVAIGQSVLRAASQQNVSHFVLLSAIHPALDSLVSHRQKRIVEENLIDSHLLYTILQPTMFMQNIPIATALQAGVVSVPYSIGMPMSFVDRQDVAEVAQRVLSQPTHARATYELVGTEPMTFTEVAACLAHCAGQPVEARQIPVETALSRFPRRTLDEQFTAETFERMFGYYNRHGLSGNSNVLRWLLGREPVDFEAYFRRALALPGAQVPHHP